MSFCRLLNGSLKMVSRILTQPSSRKQFASRRKKVIEKGEKVVICILIYILDLLLYVLRVGLSVFVVCIFQNFP